jgi:hypothetical protein
LFVINNFFVRIALSPDIWQENNILQFLFREIGYCSLIQRNGGIIMSDYQAVFKRTEIKYLLTPNMKEMLMEQIGSKLCQDAYCNSTISNLYFDTEDYQLIRTSIEKPLYKEKLRLRSYQTPTMDSKVFVELKKKVDGTVYKRRLALPYGYAMSYLAGERLPLQQSGTSPQIRNEIDWFMKRYPLSPKAFISYQRQSWKGYEDPGLRITFDKNILFRSNQLDLSDGSFGSSLLDQDTTLMEVKMNNPMPLWLSKSLNTLQIYPVSFSKYGNCYKSYILGVDNCLTGGADIA